MSLLFSGRSTVDVSKTTRQQHRRFYKCLRRYVAGIHRNPLRWTNTVKLKILAGFKNSDGHTKNDNHFVNKCTLIHLIGKNII